MPSQIPFDLPHQASLSRDDLIVSASNRLAVAAVDAWPDWRHSVLFVCGPEGSGKTHLVNAWTEIAEADVVDGATIAQTTATPGFRCAIDDLDRSGLSENDLFAAVNAARLGGGTLFLTARRPPASLAFSLPDLVSRLRAATLAELLPPDDELLTGVLAKLFADRQLAVDPKSLLYLVRRMERSLDAARRLVAAIDEEALAGKERITPRLLRRVLDRDPRALRHRNVVSPDYSAETED